MRGAGVPLLATLSPMSRSNPILTNRLFHTRQSDRPALSACGQYREGMPRCLPGEGFARTAVHVTCAPCLRHLKPELSVERSKELVFARLAKGRKTKFAGYRSKRVPRASDSW
jgi:hypothetical protein